MTMIRKNILIFFHVLLTCRICFIVSYVYVYTDHLFTLNINVFIQKSFLYCYEIFVLICCHDIKYVYFLFSGHAQMSQHLL